MDKRRHKPIYDSILPTSTNHHHHSPHRPPPSSLSKTREHLRESYPHFQSRLWFGVSVVLAACLIYTMMIEKDVFAQNAMSELSREGRKGLRFGWGLRGEPCVKEGNRLKVKVGEEGEEGEEKVKVVEKIVEKVVEKKVVDDGPPLHFITMYYPEQNQGWTEWRLNASKVVVRRNDRILRENGYEGLTVFTVPEAVDTVKTWNVSTIKVLDGITETCQEYVKGEFGGKHRIVHAELCPKKLMMLHPEFMKMKKIVLLDSDAQIVSPKFMEKIKYYKYFADFAATPDHQQWMNVKYRAVRGEFNTGIFFINTEAFDNDVFRNKILVDCKEKRQQACLSQYVKDRWSKGSIWVEYLPWNMHCRGEHYGPNCLLVHNWNEVAFKGLHWVLNNWDKHLQKI